MLNFILVSIVTCRVGLGLVLGLGFDFVSGPVT